MVELMSTWDGVEGPPLGQHMENQRARVAPRRSAPANCSRDASLERLSGLGCRFLGKGRQLFRLLGESFKLLAHVCGGQLEELGR